MTLITKIAFKATQIIPSGSSSASVAGAAADDVVLVAYLGTRSGTNAVIPPTVGASRAMTDITGDVNSGGTDGRCQVWAAKLISADFLAGSFPIGYNDQAYASHRLVYGVLHHPQGFDLATMVASVYTDINGFTAGDEITLNSGATITRENITFLVWANATTQASLQTAFDAGTARDPFWDDSSTTDTTIDHSHHYGTSQAKCQADWSEYDVGAKASSFRINVGASAAHAMAAVTIQVRAATAISGKANGVGSARAQIKAAARPTGKANAVGNARASIYAPDVGVRMSGKANAVGSARASIQPIPKVISGTSNAAASMRGNLPVKYLRARPMNIVGHASARPLVQGQPIRGTANAVADAGGTIFMLTSLNPLPSGKANAVAKARGQIVKVPINPIVGARANAVGSARAKIGRPTGLRGKANGVGSARASIGRKPVAAPQQPRLLLICQ